MTRLPDVSNLKINNARAMEALAKGDELVYIVTMYRYGDREKHSYVLGAFSTENNARERGELEKDYRGGKYEPEIIRFYVDSPTDFLEVGE